MVAGVILMLVDAAHAEMKDWQLRRFLIFHSQCMMEDFVDKSAPTGPGKFHATCRNTTFYPDGVDLDCPDREDEFTCKILTQPLDFKDMPWLNGDQNK